MKKKEFKYYSQFAINMYLSSYQFLQQTELSTYGKVQKTFTDRNPCNIYFIVKRPRISLDPDYFVIEGNSIKFKYYIHIQDTKHTRYFRLKRKKGMFNIRMETEYPYNYFGLRDDNNLNINYKLAVVIDLIHKKSISKEPLLDYEVLYIGQAYGEDGKRTAIDRLGSHSTLQKIYSEASQRNPNSEIWIMLAHFTQKNITSMNGRISMPKENEEEDFNRFSNFSNSENITEKQRINFTEAALIKTFLPKYNKEFKNTFPNPSHSSYSECYDLDINAIIVETDCSDVRRWLFSENKKRVNEKELSFNYWQHGISYFVNKKDRYKIFNYDYL